MYVHARKKKGAEKSAYWMKFALKYQPTKYRHINPIPDGYKKKCVTAQLGVI